MRAITKMFNAYANSQDMELEELEQSVIEAVQNQTLYLATVYTNYETHAIGETEAKAKQAALKSAKAWLLARGVKYKSLKEIEETLGCNVFEIPLNQAIQEY